MGNKKRVVSVLVAILLLLSPEVRSQSPQYESAEQCRKCHLARYNEWKESLHSKSAPKGNLLFAKVYERSQLDTNGGTKNYCIKCHAPVTNLNADANLTLPLTHEGVNCDVCHTISEITKEPSYWPYVADPGPVKRSAKGTGKAKGHKVSKSELFQTSEVCLGCHGAMVDIEGLAGCSGLMICDTHSEWLESPYPEEGSDCKSCHMKKDSKGKQRLHFFEGVQKGELLEKAATLKVDSYLSGGKLHIAVEVENSGTGHLLPTGPPARMVYLKVEAQDGSGKTLWSNFKENPLNEDRHSVFMISFADSSGKAPALPWLAHKIVFDTRLKPKEKAKLFYKIPPSDAKRIVATLYYRLAPLPLLGQLGITDPYYTEPRFMTQAVREI